MQAGEGVEKGEPSYVSVGIKIGTVKKKKIGTATMENSMNIP